MSAGFLWRVRQSRGALEPGLGGGLPGVLSTPSCPLVCGLGELPRARLTHLLTCPLLQACGRGSQMSREVCVHSWPCSCYFEPEKRWVPGTLSLTSHSLRFATDQTGEPLLSFPLSSVIEIKKEACPFVFSSITILEKDRVKHWFSSLQPSRNALFSIIEHFWRELLLSPADAPLPLTKGKQLTGLMACSQQRLEETARVLQHQGEQLGSIARGLDKMDSDLDVADRYRGASDPGATALGGPPEGSRPGGSPSWWALSTGTLSGVRAPRPQVTPLCS